MVPSMSRLSGARTNQECMKNGEKVSVAGAALGGAL